MRTVLRGIRITEVSEFVNDWCCVWKYSLFLQTVGTGDWGTPQQAGKLTGCGLLKSHFVKVSVACKISDTTTDTLASCTVIASKTVEYKLKKI